MRSSVERLRQTADSQNVVHELREDNNDAGIRVAVVP